MQRGLGFVEVIDEGDDPALVMKNLFLFLAVVLERDRQTLVEKGQLAEPLRLPFYFLLPLSDTLRVRLPLRLERIPVDVVGRLGELCVLVDAVQPDFDIDQLIVDLIDPLPTGESPAA